MDPTHWILLDTEISGVKPPIYVVELAAQRVRGWEPARVGRNAIAVPPLAGSHGAGRLVWRLPGGSGIGMADGMADRPIGHPPSTTPAVRP